MQSTPRQLTLALTILLAAYASGDLQAAVQAKEADQDNTVRIYKKVAPATVFIKTTLVTEHLINGMNGNLGSGVLLDDQGLILTNAHLVDGAAKILVTLHNGTRLTATLVGTDPVTDLALLQVALPKGPRTTAKLGDSDRVEIGQKVVAIGHPFGLGYAVTTGVVSGFGTTPETQASFREKVIQTSAAINPGNSGGPLVDSEARVIGINNTILTVGQNIGFAIPINTAKTVVAELRTRGRVIRPWLGITGKLVTEEVIDLFAIPMRKGLLVAHIDEDSPAQKVGLRAGALNVTIEGEPWILGGDILVAVNGLDISTPEQYMKVFKTLKVGQTITLSISRNGADQDITVTLEEQPRLHMAYSQAKVQENTKFRPINLRSGPTESRIIDMSF
ncbi:MAG TPA: trypsin-like peptidase domain-containing protein [Nitrospiraceae bacterium]|nr:trypsin-like peptidase domain-containing protein [Nitrospiraceae bacterium]